MVARTLAFIPVSSTYPFLIVIAAAVAVVVAAVAVAVVAAGGGGGGLAWAGWKLKTNKIAKFCKEADLAFCSVGMMISVELVVAGSSSSTFTRERLAVAVVFAEMVVEDRRQSKGKKQKK